MSTNQSPAARLAALPPNERERVLAQLNGETAQAVLYDWSFWARPDQLPPPGSWRYWVLRGGRGGGKTRSVAEWVRNGVESGTRRAVGLVGPTMDDVRKFMVEGPSGLLSVAPPWARTVYEPANHRLMWPNGAMAYTFSSEEPDRLRGPNLDAAWCDELCSFENLESVWTTLNMAVRLPGPRGDRAQIVISTTPRPLQLFKEILADPATVTTRSKTSDNAPNLDRETVAYLHRKYAGTTLGRQELDAEILDDSEGALWNRGLIDKNRVEPRTAPRFYDRVVVALDPAVSYGPQSDETGIVAAGLLRDKGEAHVIEDRSGRTSPQGWARAAIELAHRHLADCVCYEQNVGGRLVESVIRQFDRNVRLRAVHAKRGKALRAEPVVALYEEGRVKHVGVLAALEDQMCEWEPDSGMGSPDRLDALVYAITELLVKPRSTLVEQRRRASPRILPIFAR